MNTQGKSALPEDFHHKALSAPTLLDVDHLHLALRSESTKSMKWPNWGPWPNALKGQILLNLKYLACLSILMIISLLSM